MINVQGVEESRIRVKDIIIKTILSGYFHSEPFHFLIKITPDDKVPMAYEVPFLL